LRGDINNFIYLTNRNWLICFFLWAEDRERREKSKKGNVNDTKKEDPKI
jgi:hypothetical protein